MELEIESPWVESQLRIPRPEWVVRGASIRRMYNDKKELNEIYDQFNTDYELDVAILRAIERWNIFPPMDRFAITNFPSVYWLKNAALYEILKGEGIFKARNLLTGSNQGIEVSIHQNIQALAPFISQLFQETEKSMKDLKTAKNINGGYGALWAYMPGTYFTGF